MNQFERIKRILQFQDIAVNGDDGWFCNVYYNALCHLDLRTGKINLETFLPSLSNGKLGEFGEYGAIAYYEKKLIIAPMNGCYILFYDLITKNIDQFPIDLNGFDESNRFHLFHAVYIYQNAAYFMPARYSSIVKINLKTLEMCYLRDWYFVISKKLGDANAQLFQTSYLTDSGICILPCWQSNVILEVDFNTDKWKTFCVEENGSAFTAASYSDRAYLISFKDKATIIDIKNQKKPQIYTCTLPEFVMVNGFCALMEWGNYIWCIPLYGNMIVKLNRENGEWTYVRELSLETQEKVKPLEFAICSVLFCKRISASKLLACASPEGKILVIDVEKETVEEYVSVLAEGDIDRIERHFAFQFQKNLWMECFETDLAGYMQHIEKYKINKQGNITYENNGKKIFHMMLAGKYDV